jgi:hypothetical protein
MSAWLPLLVNAAVAMLGAAQGADWVHLIGSPQAGGIATALVAGLNVAAHAFAGVGPAATSSAGSSPN